ncbi:MAG: rhodanese-like domain-containing protein [Hyphomicrobiaceae bacterium]|nr:rhodanese-like domain-containing protein [Hyphomicrobiaceae bacterium]MCC0024025.1 rhodanese-like domain-containing protein [Hyphomicrobiaceae bacterium]
MSFGAFQSLFGGQPAGGAQVQTISGPSAVQFFGDADTVYVDVRGEAEIRMSGGTIKGAIIAPLPELARHARPDGSGTLPGIEDGKRIIMVCASGARSGAASQQLVAMGYDNVANLRGGIGAWFQAGGEVER